MNGNTLDGTTLITALGADFQVGDMIEIADSRRWWVKLWHWIIREKVQRRFVIQAVTDTTITLGD